LRRIVINGQSAFIEFFAVFEDVFADLSEVEIEVAREGRRIVLRGDERIHQPKFDVADVRRFEVRNVNLAHHAAPSL